MVHPASPHTLKDLQTLPPHDFKALCMYIYNIYTCGSSWFPFDFCDISLSSSSSIFSFASSASWKSGRRQSGFQQHDHLVPLLQNKLKIEIFKMRIKKWALRLPRCLSCWNLIFHQALGPCHDCCLYSRSALSEHPTSLRTHEHPRWHGFRFWIMIAHGFRGQWKSKVKFGIIQA